MIGAFLGGLFIAWFLTIFNIDDIVIKGCKDLFGLQLTEASYYLIAGLLGILSFVAKVNL